MIRAVLLACVIASASACSSTPTQLVVEVDSDFLIPTELDRIRVVIRDGAGQVTAERAFQLVDRDADPAKSTFELPLSFAVLQGDGPDSGRANIEVQGQLGTALPIVRQTASVAFIDGERISIRLFLAKACLNIMCPTGETCELGGCVDIVEEPVDAGVDRSDATVATMDSSVDGGVTQTDASVPVDDAAVSLEDAFRPVVDAYIPPVDAYVAPIDAYMPPADAGTAMDAGTLIDSSMAVDLGNPVADAAVVDATVTCEAGALRNCGGACVPCPTSHVVTTTCSAGNRCIATSCNGHFVVMDGVCVDDDDD